MQGMRDREQLCGDMQGGEQMCKGMQGGQVQTGMWASGPLTLKQLLLIRVLLLIQLITAII